MTREETKEVIIAIEQVYRNFFKSESAADAKARLNIWSVALANEPAQEVMEALVEALKVCKYPPTIADIFEQLRTRRAKALPNEAEIWKQTTAARQISTNSYHARNGGIMGPTKKTASDLRNENQRIFESLPEAVRNWAGGPGELAAMFDKSDSDITSFVRPAFKKAIEAARADQVKDIEQLPPADRPKLIE